MIATDGSDHCDRAPLDVATAAQTPSVLPVAICQSKVHLLEQQKERKEKCSAVECSSGTTTTPTPATSTTAVMSLNGANLTLLPVCVCVCASVCVFLIGSVYSISLVIGWIML